jgi:hypothetical protein
MVSEETTARSLPDLAVWIRIGIERLLRSTPISFIVLVLHAGGIH